MSGNGSIMCVLYSENHASEWFIFSYKVVIGLSFNSYGLLSVFVFVVTRGRLL